MEDSTVDGKWRTPIRLDCGQKMEDSCQSVQVRAGVGSVLDLGIVASTPGLLKSITKVCGFKVRG